GKPLPGVTVRFGDVSPVTGGRYDSPSDADIKTDADGRFRADRLPAGSAKVWVHKPGYVRPGLGPSITTPKDDVELTMSKSGSVKVTVDFGAGPKPGEYMVAIEPEGGNKIGSHGGSGIIDAANKMTFNDLPPGKYFIHGHPNPTSDNQKTDPIPIDIKGGDSAELTLKAKL
ncbi:MAG TPA: carboxypeptidase-like regulatory domain-containing protein, partial [Planctomycetia bacterium]|nr:carboxypeptidase-like regulatory domain-containing protein [Planctomycetia bacterium]